MLTHYEGVQAQAPHHARDLDEARVAQERGEGRRERGCGEGAGGEDRADVSVHGARNSCSFFLRWLFAGDDGCGQCERIDPAEMQAVRDELTNAQAELEKKGIERVRPYSDHSRIIVAVSSVLTRRRTGREGGRKEAEQAMPKNDMSSSTRSSPRRSMFSRLSSLLRLRSRLLVRPSAHQRAEDALRKQPFMDLQ